MASRGLSDLPEYASFVDGAPSLRGYLKVVREVLAEPTLGRWRVAVASHSHPVAYVHLANSPSPAPSMLLGEHAPWPTRLHHILLCRFRAGLVIVAHCQGCVSRARTRTCIGCSNVFRRYFVHAIASCPRWAPQQLGLPLVISGSS